MWMSGRVIFLHACIRWLDCLLHPLGSQAAAAVVGCHPDFSRFPNLTSPHWSPKTCHTHIIPLVFEKFTSWQEMFTSPLSWHSTISCFPLFSEPIAGYGKLSKVTCRTPRTFTNSSAYRYESNLGKIESWDTLKGLTLIGTPCTFGTSSSYSPNFHEPLLDISSH